MKKYIRILIILLFVVFLFGCDSPIDKLINTAKEKVNKEISKIEDVGKDKIKESVLYLVKNYNKKINKDYVYYVLLLDKISDDSYYNESKVRILADKAFNYMMKQSENNKKELDHIVEEIEGNEDEIIDEFFVMYKNYNLINKSLDKGLQKVIKDLKYKDGISEERITNAIKYIISNYRNPLKNKEVIENLTYYTMYINEIGTKYSIDNEITKIANNCKKYIQTNNMEYYKNIERLISKINKNIDSLVSDMMKVINK